MGILTNQQSARSFSSYVTIFGIGLLISSIIYFNRIDNSEEKINCNEPTILNRVPSCDQINSWRVAAIVGIVIGVIDTLILPFLCCCLCCTACGCAICVAVGCPEVFSENKGNVESTTRNGDTDITEATTINVEDNDPPKVVNKYDVESVPSRLHVWLNALAWIVWVFGPFAATLYIVIALYKYDAIRTSNDSLFESALTLFIMALFNLMVYFQKFIDSLCGYGHKKVTKK